MANEFVARNGLIAQANSQITGSLIVTNGITADLTGTASYASNANSLDGLDSTQLTLTSSFNSYTSSINSYTQSLNSATSSFVQNNQTSSFATFTALNAYTSSINTYTSSLNSATGAFATFTALNTYTSSINTYTSSLNSATGAFATFTALNAYTSSTNNFSASILSYTQSLNSATGAFATFTALNAYTSSTNNFSASILSYTASNNTTNTTQNNRLTGLENYTSSLNSTTSSFVLNSQTSSFVQNSQTSSMSVLSASYAATTSFASNFTVANTLTAQTLVVQTVSSSVVYSSGSNRFGNDLTNTQVLTGSVIVTGSLSVNGSNVVLTNQTSSFVQNSQTGAFATFTALNAYTASENAFSASILSYTQSLNSSTGAFATFTALNAYTSSINTFSASILSYTQSLNSATGAFATFTSLNAYTSSINTYTSSLNSKTSSFATTGSNNFIGTENITGSLNVSGSTTLTGNTGTTVLNLNTDVLEFTGSLFTSGAASLSGSINISGSLLVNGNDIALISQTGSFATFTAFNAYTSSTNAFSASILSYTASQNNLNGTFATTSSLNAYTSSINSYTSSLNSATSSFVRNSQTSSMTVLSASYALTSSKVDVIQNPGAGQYSIIFAALSGVGTGSQQLAVTGSDFSYEPQAGRLNVQNLNGTASYAITASRSDLATSIYTPGGTATRLLYQSAGGGSSTTTTDAALVFSSGTGTLSATSMAVASSGTFKSALDGSNNISMHDGSFGIIAIRNGGVDKITINRDGASIGEILLSGSVRSTGGFTGSFSGSLSGTASFASSSTSASYASNAELLDGLDSTVFTSTSSFNAYTSSINTYTSSLNSATSSFATFTALNAYTSSINSYTSSLNSKTSSFATTGSNIFNGNQVITGSLTVGSGSVGVGENTLIVGPAPAGGTGEGGQILLSSSGSLYPSASMIDNYQNTFRVLNGSNAGSNRMDLELSHVTQNLRIFGDVIAFAASDKRLKENIQPIPNALDKLDKIGGYTFDWKTEGDLLSLHGHEGRDIGVIAQEIENILPEVVTTRDSGYKAVKYEKIVPLLIQAIKEQQEQIKELQDIIKNK